MKLSKTSAHAALAMAFLAGQTDSGPTQARQIAKHLNIPTDSALKILQSLARQQVIQSHLGRTGGYSLSKSPEAITLLDVVEAIDGPIVAQLPIDPNTESLVAVSAVLQQACEQVAERLRDELSRFTVADLAHEPEMLVAG